jgi:hypothetical protein
MRQPKVYMMGDFIDEYIRHNIKSWVGRHQPSASLRGRLLLLAASRDHIDNPDDLNAYGLPCDKKINCIRPLATNRFPAERMVEPVAQARLWLLHIYPSFLRMVT